MRSARSTCRTSASAGSKKTLSIEISGVNVAYGTMRNLIPVEGGRFLDQRDLDERRRVIFLGDQLKKDLFGEETAAVGRSGCGSTACLSSWSVS